jgi:hypothetical protein
MPMWQTPAGRVYWPPAMLIQNNAHMQTASQRELHDKELLAASVEGFCQKRFKSIDVCSYIMLPLIQNQICCIFVRRGGRIPHPLLRQANVIVFTDGRPLSFRKTTMASHMVRKVARLIWVPVTRYAPLKSIKLWVSLPNSTRSLCLGRGNGAWNEVEISFECFEMFQIVSNGIKLIQIEQFRWPATIPNTPSRPRICIIDPLQWQQPKCMTISLTHWVYRISFHMLCIQIFASCICSH